MALALESAVLDPYAGPHETREPRETPKKTQEQGLASSVEGGRLVELCGLAPVSAAMTIVFHTQSQGEPVAWVQRRRGPLFAPDLAASGLDLDALVVVHIPEQGGPHGPIRAGELLLRSGAFGLLVIDLRHRGSNPRLGSPTAWQGRLLGLAREHETKVVLLSGCLDDPVAREDASLGPLIGLRVDSRPVFDTTAGVFRLEHRVLKNKSGAPLSIAPDYRRGPRGLHS